MASTIRPIVIDDTDAAIKYTGQGWFQDVGDNWAGNGKPYLRTIHGTTGTYISVLGTIYADDIPIVNGTGNGTTWDPKWECFIDGVGIGYSPDLFRVTRYYPENNLKLCEGRSDLADGHHTLTLNVTSTGNNTFWFDQLRFTPSPGSTYGNGTNVVMIELDDPAIQYGHGWKPWTDNPDVNVNITQNSQLRLNFTGTSLSWYGMVPVGDSDPKARTPGFSSYSIDGGSPVVFVASTNIKILASHQLYFTTPGLSPAEHSLLVHTNSTLGLMYFYVTNVTIPSSGSVGSPQSGGVAPSPSSSPTSSSSSSPTSSSSSGPKSSSPSAHFGPILGGAFGGIFLIALILSFLYRQKKRWQEFPQQAQAFTTTREGSPFALSTPVIHSIQKPPLPAPFGTPQPFAIPPDQLNGDFPYFSRPLVKSVTLRTRAHLSPQGVGRVGLPGNNSTQQLRETTALGPPRGDERSRAIQHQDSSLRVGPDLTTDSPPVYTPG